MWLIVSLRLVPGTRPIPLNHNRQSLRVVDLLEQRYPDHPGLNLSYEVREGIVKHETSVPMRLDEFDRYRQPTLEACLVDIADEIAYNSHDIDDGLSSGLLSFEDFLGARFREHLGLDSDGSFLKLSVPHRRYALVRRLVNQLATDVISETQRRIRDLSITDLASVRTCGQKICGYSEMMQQVVDDVKQLLRSKLYRHERLVALSDRARRIIETIFDCIHGEPSLMPERFRKMLADEQEAIVIADYIAGMTDRYAEQMYEKLVG